MTIYSKITRSPETLGAFLRGLPVIEAPWDREFQKRYCSKCGRKDCDVCPHEKQRNNPEWWLSIQSK